MKQILDVEDELDINEMIGLHLHDAGDAIARAYTAEEALNLLVRNRGRVYSRDELLSMIRDNGIDLELGNIDVYVHNLR